MLAQNFKTAADLGIEEKQLSALVTVLGMLERGELRHTRERGANSFHMDMWSVGDCGSPQCIGGWAQKIGNVSFAAGTGGLSELFFPYTTHSAFEATPDQAASALRNYLTLGEPRWREVLA